MKVAAKSQESSRKVAAKSQESSRKVAAKSQESSRKVAAKSQVKKRERKVHVPLKPPYVKESTRLLIYDSDTQ